MRNRAPSLPPTQAVRWPEADTWVSFGVPNGRGTDFHMGICEPLGFAGTSSCKTTPSGTLDPLARGARPRQIRSCLRARCMSTWRRPGGRLGRRGNPSRKRAASGQRPPRVRPNHYALDVPPTTNPTPRHKRHRDTDSGKACAPCAIFNQFVPCVQTSDDAADPNADEGASPRGLFKLYMVVSCPRKGVSKPIPL